MRDPNATLEAGGMYKALIRHRQDTGQHGKECHVCEGHGSNVCMIVRLTKSPGTINTESSECRLEREDPGWR